MSKSTPEINDLVKIPPCYGGGLGRVGGWTLGHNASVKVKIDGYWKNVPLSVLYPARSLKQVNKAIQEQVGDFVLRKGPGYYYVGSDNFQNSMFCAGLHYTSIQYVSKLNQQSVDQWVDDVEEVLAQHSNFDHVLNQSQQPSIKLEL